MKNNWEKEFDKFGEIWTTYFGVHNVEGNSANWNMKVKAKCDTKNLKSFISNLLAQKDKEHIEMTKELVAKKNKDCQRYLETQRTQILEEFEEMIGENINILGFTGDKPSDYVEGKVEGYNQAKQEIRDKLNQLKE